MIEGKDKANNLKARRGAKYAVFILSYGRPDMQLTLDTLMRQGYSGDWYIVCDDEDESLDKYQDNYGDKVLVFNKSEVADEIDLYTQEINWSAAVFARQESQRMAKDLGYDYMAMLDDDLEDFVIRYEDEGKLKSHPISDINVVIQAFFEYMADNKQITSLGFGNNGGYIGGLEGRFKQGMTRHAGGSFFIRLDNPIDFKGNMHEDYITHTIWGKLGHLFLVVMDVAFSTGSQGSNEGGMQDYYNESTNYINEFYGLIANPSTMHIVGLEDRNRAKRTWKNHSPQIVSSKWRKSDE